MEPVSMFMVEKFLPPACPACEHPFASPADFGLWAGPAPADTFAEAQTAQARRFPELYEVRDEHDAPFVNNRFSSDFIFCRRCENKTLRISYGFSQVPTRREAERLVVEAGFTCMMEITASGTHAKRMTGLSFLGQADLARANAAARAAREGTKELDEDQAGERFMARFDPMLMELTDQLQRQDALAVTRVQLSEQFGAHWDGLGQDCRRFLETGELLHRELERFVALDPNIDFSPAVGAYSKALEVELTERIFLPFRESHLDRTLRGASDPAQERSAVVLQGFVAGTRPLGLGEMAQCLKNLGCGGRQQGPRELAAFLRETLQDLDGFCDATRFPRRLSKYVAKFRNAAAHVDGLGAEECRAARAFLLEEPVRLLLTLAEATTPGTEPVR